MGNKKKYPSKVSKSGNRSRRMKRLITARKDIPPGPHARVCSCHFLNGIKENGPILYERKPGGSPQKSKRWKPRLVPNQHSSTYKEIITNAVTTKPGISVHGALNLSHFPAAQIREWHLKRQRGQLEEQPRLEQSEVVSCRTENNLSDVKEEVIEVEEPQLVKVKDEPVDAAEYILSDNPVDVHLEEEPANEGGFSYVANNSDSFDIGTRPGSTQVKKLSVREVDSMFVDFATRFKSLSLKTQQTLKAKISQLLSEAEATEGGQHQ